MVLKSKGDQGVKTIWEESQHVSHQSYSRKISRWDKGIKIMTWSQNRKIMVNTDVIIFSEKVIHPQTSFKFLRENSLPWIPFFGCFNSRDRDSCIRCYSFAGKQYEKLYITFSIRHENDASSKIRCCDCFFLCDSQVLILPQLRKFLREATADTDQSFLLSFLLSFF